MSAEEIVRAVLLGLTPVTALVATRVYLKKLPQSPTYPCVLVQLVPGEQVAYHLRGEDGLVSSRVQVDSFAKERGGVDAYALADAVANAVHGDGAGSGLSGWSGAIGSPAQRIQGIFRLERNSSYDPDEIKVVHISQDYNVMYQR